MDLEALFRSLLLIAWIKSLCSAYEQKVESGFEYTDAARVLNGIRGLRLSTIYLLSQSSAKVR